MRIEHMPHYDPPKVAIKSRNPEYAGYERIAEKVRAHWTRRLGRTAAVIIQSHKEERTARKAGRAALPEFLREGAFQH